MNLRRFAVAAVAALVVSSSLFGASPNVVISQVYGGGGNSGATYKNDFIELFNRGTSTVSLGGMSVQYTSATGTGLFGGSANLITVLPAVNLAPGHYFLIQESAGSGNGVVLPAADLVVSTNAINMSATEGKVALVNSTTSLGCNGGSTPCTGQQLGLIVDLVGYGAANFFETAATVPLTSSSAAIRKNGGCTDTDNNSADFTVTTPAPRNSATAVNSCTVTNNPPVINGVGNPITTVLQNAAPFNVSLSGTDDNNVFNWSATPGAGVSSVVVASGGTTANVTFTVTLVSNFTGTATFTAALSDNVNSAATLGVNIQVNAAPVDNPPTITPPNNPITTVETNAPPFTVQIKGNDDGGIYNWSATAGTGVSLVSLTAGQGTANATFTVTLQGGFSGTATFTANLSDNVNATLTQTVNITVNAPPPPPNHLVISQIYGGGGNSGATYQNDYVEIYNPTSSSVNVSGWTLQYQAATSTGNWSGLQPIGGVIGAGEYFLVALASGGATGAPLPTPNIDASSAGFNMSATAGKVALVSTGDVLSGCPVSNAALVDLVGYGTTANCREGSLNAPAASNTTALFRKNSGLTDTDVNGNDFVSSAPNPRRTAPIQEIGPFVVTIDPVSGATIAPKDASITVTFSEPVDVVGQWYDITCATSGAHNGATFASTDGGATRVITPNINFQPGEKCTVTIFASQVHDSDTDDSTPGTDTLPANKSWSFTVATGADAPYPASVHLTMGNPSNAVADANVPNNYLMDKPTYALSYNKSKGTPNWVSWHLASEWYGTLNRVDTFRPDPAVPSDWYRVQAFDFFATGFDRGHMCPNADRDNENRIPINQETYLMSNMVPQAPDNNQGPWANLENYLRTLTDAGNELYIVSGPAGVGGSGSNGGVTTTLAGGHVTVPAYTWKAVLVLPKADGDDAARVNAATRTIAVIMPNTQGIRTTNSNDWQGYLTSVSAVEQLTGYKFFTAIQSEAIRNAVINGVNGTNPPGVANESVSTNEDNAKTFSFEAASATNAALTFTNTSTPAHGTLTISGNTATYTPAADFNGTDSFSYKASDGTATSNTATVTISVLEVNDAPAAGDDTKSTDEDTPLIFAASDLLANDSAGPANESSQTLTVTAVSLPVHGTVTLSNAQITFVPAANYNGPAAFTYHVCDNGFTAGASDSKCADGTVNVIVNAVNDAPVAANDAKSTDEDVPLAFNASDLTANDSAGPADEAAQTLTVSAVDSAVNGSVELKNGAITFTPSPNFNGGASFRYQVCDNGTPSLCAYATVNVTVNPVNDAPTIDAIADQTVEIGGSVSFTATAADIDSPLSSLRFGLDGAPAGALIDPVTGAFTWTPATAQAHAIYTFKVTVSDGFLTTPATVNINVTDTTGPAMSDLKLGTMLLWPANHQMVDVSVDYTDSDLGDAAPVCTLSVLSNEPVNGLGDGDMAPDWTIVDANHVRLRAERSGTGNGRVYTITATCADKWGNASQKSATVTVPKSNNGK